MAYEGLLNNTNAEVWDIDSAKELFNDAFNLANRDEYDFIGEVARDLGTYRDLFSYLSKKFPELKVLYNKILSTLEANCFSHSKTGKIKEATAIVNLKSNYNWTDRLDQNVKSDDGSMSPNKNTDLSKLSDKELLAYKKLQKKVEN
jgi:hypothetical protein